MRRVKMGKEPVLHIHRYVVAIGRPRKEGKRTVWTTTYKYAENLPEAREFRNEAPKGSFVELYRARHDFIEAWDCGYLSKE